jgi:ADP-heptose:LPS heptosyltransferase
MKKKKILFIWAASGLWDRIAIIPKLVDLKKQWYHITFLAYEPAYFTLFYNVDEILEIYKKSKLYDKILLIPRNKRKLIRFVLRNLWKFDESYTPTNTFFSSLLWKLFSKKYSYAFDNATVKDNGKYDNIVEATLNHEVKSLFEYKKFLKIDYNNEYKNKLWINKTKFVTLFVSLYCRCIEIVELEKIINFLNKEWFMVILLWWDREKWICEYIDIKKHNILDLLGKTKIWEAASILSDSVLNISMDGWLMWLWHLMNKYNISIQNISLYIMKAPVDNSNSFNIRNYEYPNCTPCNYFWAPEKWEKNWIKTCVFYWTDREWECRFTTKGEHITKLIKQILNKQKQ